MQAVKKTLASKKTKGKEPSKGKEGGEREEKEIRGTSNKGGGALLNGCFA